MKPKDKAIKYLKNVETSEGDNFIHFNQQDIVRAIDIALKVERERTLKVIDEYYYPYDAKGLKQKLEEN